jgi:carotenoid cleavage dioxygenase-like enzyme
MHYLGGEPVFIGQPSTQNVGAIICQVFDAEHMTSAFALFDAFHVAHGPVAMLRLREPLPPLFHAAFHRGE